MHLLQQRQRQRQQQQGFYLSIINMFGCSGKVFLVVSHVGAVDEHIKGARVVMIVVVANTSAGVGARCLA